jgi:transposase
MSTPMPRASTNQFIEVVTERLEGAPVGERRRWSDEFKDRAVAASLEPGTNISALARSLDISPSQLFGWRRAAQRNGPKVGRRRSLEASAGKAGLVEIEVGGSLVRVKTDIAEDDLRRLLRAVREA